MFSNSILAAVAAFSLIIPTSALYDPSSPANLAMYWGQGNNQQNLSYFCDQSSVDIIPIGFVDYFPQQTSGGVPGANFANACWAGSAYPGSDNLLPERCVWLQENIPYCQAKGKKIILSLGGGYLTYQLTGKDEGTAFANQLWQMYGPYNATYVAQGGIRPLDGGYWNDKTDPAYWIDIDGFDFDIELASTDNAVGYIAMLTQLRKLFLTNPCKKYLITGSPQCSVPDANMGAMIQEVAFDALWVQFYNTKACSARTWVGGNSALNSTNGKNSTASFTYDDWVSTTAKGASKNAKIYIGLLGGPAGTSSLHSGDFLWPTEAINLIKTYVKDTRFGGVMLWEATVADEQFVKSGGGLVNYYNFIKSVLKPYGPQTIPAISIGSVCFSTTSSSSSTRPTSSSTTSKSSTSTTSSSSSTRPTSSPTTSKSSTFTTSSSSSTRPTSSPTTSKSSTYTTSSSSSTSTSSTSSTHSSYPTSSPASSSASSTPSSSSSSPSSTITPTSSPLSTSATTTSSPLSSSTSPAPNGLPTDCVFEGCWTEGDGVRALPALSYVDYDLMSEEICYDFCVTQHGYPLFGLEYGGECWCGDALDQTSQNVTDSGDCSMPCGGTPDEFCGNGNRLDVYSCGSGSSSPPSSSQSSYSASVTPTPSSSTSQSSTVVPTSSPTSESSSSSSTTSAYGTSSAATSATIGSSSTPSSTNSLSESSYSTYSTSSESSTSSETPTSNPTSTATVSSSSTYSISTTSALTSSSESQYTTATSAGVTSSPSLTSTLSFSSVYSSSSNSAPTSSPSSTLSLSTCTSGSTSLSGTPSSTSISAYNNSTSVTPTQSPSVSSSNSGVVYTPSGSSTLSSSGVVYTPSRSSTLSSSGIVYTPSGSSTLSSSGVVTTPYTTSTVYSTSIYTITSCAPTVTNCPGRLGQVTTEIISLYTTVCPVTETEGSGGEAKPTPTSAAPSSASYAALTTSTVYTTKIYTITSCAPTVTNCPAKLGKVTTEVISLYTTVCPVAEATSTPVAPAILGAGYQVSSAGVKESSYSTTTISSTVTQYRTVKVVKSTATIVPVPNAPYPTGPASSGGVVGSGTGLPSVSLVFISPSPSTIAQGQTSAVGGVSATPTPAPSTYTGAGSKLGGSMIAVALAVIVALMV